MEVQGSIVHNVAIAMIGSVLRAWRWAMERKAHQGMHEVGVAFVSELTVAILLVNVSCKEPAIGSNDPASVADVHPCHPLDAVGGPTWQARVEELIPCFRHVDFQELVPICASMTQAS